MTEQGTALSTQRMTSDDWRMITEQSTALEAAGKGTAILPKGITNRYQISAILQKGWELGFAPMYSLEQIALVNGKPIVQSQALTALIQHAHGGDAVRVFETTDDRAVIGFKRKGETEYQRMEWTIQMADRAGLLQKPGPWKQYPRTMLRWRCIAEGARIFFADTIAGLYLPDEMGVSATVDSSGNLVFIEHPGTSDGAGGESRVIEEVAAEPEGRFDAQDLEMMAAPAEDDSDIIDAESSTVDTPQPPTEQQIRSIGKLAELLERSQIPVIETFQQAASLIQQWNSEYSERRKVARVG